METIRYSSTPQLGDPSQYSNQATGWTTGVRFPAEAKNSSLRHRVQTGFQAHPASYPMGTGVSFPGGKAAGARKWPVISI
jgi:hypothetical protein